MFTKKYHMVFSKETYRLQTFFIFFLGNYHLYQQHQFTFTIVETLTLGNVH